MNTFFKHYWSLFIDIIEDFSEIKYKNIPLPLLIVLQSYIDDEIRSQMNMDTFGDQLKNKLENENQIQPSFNFFLSTINNSNVQHRNTGKILIHDGDLIRFPLEFLCTFDNSKTDFLFSAKVKQNRSYSRYIHNLEELGTVHILDNYRVDVNVLTNQYTQKLESLFYKYKDHPIYSNVYFQNKFLQELPVMVDLLVAYDNFFNKNDIACVIVGNTSGMYSRILTLMAYSKGIPSVCTQHGIIANEVGYMPAFASKYAVFGHYENEWYKDQGVSSNTLEITGHPRFDQIFTRNHMSKNKFERILQITSDKKIVFIATNLISEINSWTTFINHLTKNPQITVIIKPHPSEVRKLGTNHYINICTMNKSVKLAPKTINLYDIMANSDIVVQELSTVGLEAMLLGKPVFCLRKENYYDINDRYYYEKLTKFTHHDPNKLVKLINYFLENSSMQKEYTTKIKEFISYAYPQTLSDPKIHDLIFNLSGLNVRKSDDKI